MSAFAAVFGLVFVSELPGKTTFATALLAARQKPLPVFLGAAAAFLIHTLLAVAAGGLLAELSRKPLEILIGLLFLAITVLLWREKPPYGGAPTPVDDGFGKTAKLSFGLVFLAQWGDPSQLATAALAARFGAAVTFVPATLAFWAVAGLAALVGQQTKGRVRPEVLHKAAAAIFALLGVGLLARSLRS